MARRPSQRRDNQNEVQSTSIQRTLIKDLPPDRQAEIKGAREVGKARKRHVYRPQIPAAIEAVEFHTAEVQQIYVQHFAACNEYAIAIDFVARERLREVAAYNAYLQEFDDAIETLTEKMRSLYGTYEEQSNGGMTTSQTPQRLEAMIQSRRTYQLLQQFRQADAIIRMIQFLSYFGNLDDRRARRDITQVSAALNRCAKMLRKVKVRCFAAIIQQENLPLPDSDRLTTSDLERARTAVRRAGAVKDSAKPSKTTRRRVRSKPDERIDPSAPVTEDLQQGPIDVVSEGDPEPVEQKTPQEQTEVLTEAAAS